MNYVATWKIQRFFSFPNMGWIYGLKKKKGKNQNTLEENGKSGLCGKEER